MNNYVKLITESLSDLSIDHLVVCNDVISIKKTKYYISIYESELNKFTMLVGTYNEYESENIEFTMVVYPMQYYNFKELFKMWFTGNDNVITAYFNYRDKTDDE